MPSGKQKQLAFPDPEEARVLFPPTSLASLKRGVKDRRAPGWSSACVCSGKESVFAYVGSGWRHVVTDRTAALRVSG